MAKEIWRLGEQGDLSCESLLNVEADPRWGGVITDLLNAGENRGNYAETLAGDLELLEYQRRRRTTAPPPAEVDKEEYLRSLTRGPQRRDHRRRPW